MPTLSVPAALQRRPMTFHEIARATGLDGQQVNKRLPELERAGQAVPTDEMRRVRPAGNAACGGRREASGAVGRWCWDAVAGVWRCTNVDCGLFDKPVRVA